MKKNLLIGIVGVAILTGCASKNNIETQPKSVVDMMGNQKIVGWVDYKQDTDKDGVPDYKDKCPNTPAGAKVDKNGCAIDSDKDGVIDLYDMCPNTPFGVKVNEKGCAVDTDSDAIPDYKDKCPNTPKNIVVDEHGCAIDSDGDGVYDYYDKCPNTPAGTKVNFQGCPILAEYRFNFAFDSYKIDKKYYPQIKVLAELLKQNKAITIEIQGYTDNIGTKAYNLKLSQKRANALKEILVKEYKINPNRIKTIGYGESHPIASNATKEGRAKNRRIVVIDNTNFKKDK